MYSHNYIYMCVCTRAYVCITEPELQNNNNGVTLLKRKRKLVLHFSIGNLELRQINKLISLELCS